MRRARRPAPATRAPGRPVGLRPPASRARGLLSALLLASLCAPALAQTDRRSETQTETGAVEAAETATAQPCGAVEIAAFPWPAAEIAAALLARTLSDGHGCAATVRPAEPDRALAALIEATPDAPAPPLIAPGLARADLEPHRAASPAPAIALGAPLFDARERAGWYVPAWFAAAHPQVRTLADAVAAAALFTERGALEKPQLHLCPAAWPCAVENRRVAEELGAGLRFELVEAPSGDAHLTAFERAARDRKPWIGYLWTPSAAAARAPVARLDLGQVRLCEAGRCRRPFEASPLVTAYPAAWAARAPAAAATLDRFVIPLDRLRAGLALIGDGASPRQAADALLADDPELIGRWLDPEARARFERRRAERAAAPD